MFSHFGETAFYLWLGIGSIVAFLSGFFTMSQGSFFKSVPGLLSLNVSYLTLLGIAILIAVQFSVMAAVVALVVFAIVLVIGGKSMVGLLRR